MNYLRYLRQIIQKIFGAELLSWMIRAPLYAAAIVFTVIFVSFTPIALELPLKSSGFWAVRDLLEIAYIWFGIAAIGAGYAFAIAFVPAALTGLTRLIMTVARFPETFRNLWTYISAIGFSILVAIYFAQFMGWPISFEYLSLFLIVLVVFISFALLCCFLTLRKLSAVQNG
jgi:hypothetical protein